MVWVWMPCRLTLQILWDASGILYETSLFSSNLRCTKTQKWPTLPTPWGCQTAGRLNKIMEHIQLQKRHGQKMMKCPAVTCPEGNFSPWNMVHQSPFLHVLKRTFKWKELTNNLGNFSVCDVLLATVSAARQGEGSSFGFDEFCNQVDIGNKGFWKMNETPMYCIGPEKTPINILLLCFQYLDLYC